MTRLIPLIVLGTCLPAFAIPNSILGGIVQADSPLNDTDITGQLLAADLWDGSRDLPGKWRAEAPVAATRYSHLLARPKAFGLPVVMCQAAHRGDSLESLTLTFADAGSFFGYYNERLPEGLSQREARAELMRRLAEKQEKFTTLYDETLEDLETRLKDLTDSRPRENSIGKTITLRAEATDYRKDDLVLRLITGEGRLIRLMILPKDRAQRVWLDGDLADLPLRERHRHFEEAVTRNEHGDVTLPALPLVPQGYRPYCGLNTLAMASRYFGLHLDEDWLAVGGKFQNTGSASGSQMLRLYQSVAKEAGLNMTRDNNFKLTEARSTLRQGYPVIVWRRFSHERNNFHTRHARVHARDASLAIPKPTLKERESWPGDDAPVHASVVVGFNDEHNEVLFLESWAGLDFPRRMRAEELEATATMAFYFKP
jgi:hypothetical protein